MGKNYFNFKNFTTTLLITSFIVMPFYGIPKKAEAQSLGAYVTGLAPAITQLPLCTDKLTGATKSLFTGPLSAAWGALNEKLGAKIGNVKSLTQEQKEALQQSDSISTYDEEANKKLKELKKDINEVKTSTASLDANDTCLKNIGRLVIKMLLQKMTISTVNWINSGFDGKPAFIQNPSKFFEDIAKNEFLQFGAEINNEALFPFGKAWLRNQAEHFNDKFADNARYSLDELIRNTTPQYSAAGFWLNFDQGGWGAWSAMTQYPQNNSLGFQLMASNELQRRLVGTSQSTAQNVREALQAADGFLGDERCIEAGTGKINLDITKSEYNAALRKTPPEYLCSSWQYVTPGKLIAEAATSTIKYPENNLLKADDLNDAMAAIMDALLSRFSADLMEKGYANLGSDGSDGLLAYAQGSFSGDNRTQTEKDFRPIQLASSWLSANPDFDIRTDLNQALIDEQRTYIEKLEAQNIELYSTTDGKDYKIDAFNYELPNGTATTAKMSNAYGLIPAINQLDYCIPGPHPGWEEDSRRALDAVTNVIIPETVESISHKSNEEIQVAAQAVAPAASAAVGGLIGAKIGATAGSAIFPVVGTVIGAAVGVILASAVAWLWGGDDDDEKEIKLRRYYASIIGSLTGISVNPDPADHKSRHPLSSKQGMVQALNVILERYIDIMHLVYNKEVLPSMYENATAEYNKLQGYGQIIENNKYTISAMKNVVTTLEQIKRSVDTLTITRGNYSEEIYENQLQDHISAFGRISANMVSGDDIASADNLLKQIIDEANYVYNDLLKGPYGCERELEGDLAHPELDKLPLQLYQTKRANYPAPILYTYNMDAGKEIPDPWNGGFNNKTNIKATNKMGPGFLSYYYFQHSDTKLDAVCTKAIDNVVPWCELKIMDVIPFKVSGFADRNNSFSGEIRTSLGAIPPEIETGGTASTLGTGTKIPGILFTIYRHFSSPFENTIFVY